MRIETLWGTRKDFEHSPELMVAWDENCLDGWREGFEDECEKARESWGDQLAEWRLITIEIPASHVARAFAQERIEGKVSS